MDSEEEGDDSSEGGSESIVERDDFNRGPRGVDGDGRMLMLVHAQQAPWADLRRFIPKVHLLKSHNISIPEVHFHEDLGRADLAKCDTGLGIVRDGNPRDAIIHVGLRFETLEKVQLFLQE
ncbi:hypothetical protein BS78_05G283100 [Paspalum vaginatum]|nr:hypothetical protein BS78_05G283100 [Paspalum vaginatum]